MRNKLIHGLLVLTLSFATVSPVIAATSGRAQVPNTTQANFCSRFDSIRANAIEKLGELEEKRLEQRTTIESKLEAIRTDRENRLTEIRERNQAKLDSGLETLDEETATEEEKQALIEFKATLKTLQATRRSAVDTAQKSFRTELAKLTTQRHTAVKSAVDTYKLAVQNAVAKAKTDCASTTADPESIRKALLQAMQTARENLQTALKAVDKIGTQAEALTKTRNEAVRSASNDFKTAFVAAKELLKASFSPEE